MIADATPPAIARCLDSHGREKRAFYVRSDARRKLVPGERTYRCGICGYFHKTKRRP